MESKISSSFIPHEAPSGRIKKPMYTRGAVDIIVLGAVIFLFSSLALALGVFLYQQFLNASLASKTEQLQRAREAFDPTLIQELTRLDDRMSAANGILQNHLAPSELLILLEELTLKTVAYKNLEFNATNISTMTLMLDGLAYSVNSIALQADILGRHTAVASPIFANINRTDKGVAFDVEATINPSALRYVEHISGTPATPSPSTSGAPQDDSIPLFVPSN